VRSRETEGSRERTRERKKASKRAKAVIKLVTVRVTQGDRERRVACRTVGKGAFSQSGNQAIVQ